MGSCRAFYDEQFAECRSRNITETNAHIIAARRVMEAIRQRPPERWREELDQVKAEFENPRWFKYWWEHYAKQAKSTK